jgi:hypothetical protein
LQELCDFIQAETQPLGGLDKLHPRHVCFAIAADAAGRTHRLRQQSFTLIKTDGFHIDLGGPGKSADGQIIEIRLHTD